MRSLLIRKYQNPAISKQVPHQGAASRSPRRTGIRSVLVVSCVLIFVLVRPLALSGQKTFRNLAGTVTDGQHEPLKGVVVEVENSVNMTVVSYITGRSGTYTFKRLDGDTDYRVWATFRGQRSRVKQLSKFDSDKPKIINFVIKER